MSRGLSTSGPLSPLVRNERFGCGWRELVVALALGSGAGVVFGNILDFVAVEMTMLNSASTFLLRSAKSIFTIPGLN
jgi:hypothetical protein